MAFKVPEKYRISRRHAPSAKGDLFGWFQIEAADNRRALIVLATNGAGASGENWEHVSARAFKRIHGGTKSFTPTWDEMNFIKSLFWDEEDVVVQYHPRKSDYVNNQPNVLHLWRHSHIEFLTPPAILVGLKGVELNG